MSSPFPLEEQSDAESINSGQMSDPWHGPSKPGFFAGFGYNDDNAYLGPLTPILTGIGSAVSKAVAGAAGGASAFYGGEASLGDSLARAVGLHPDPDSNPLKMLSEELARTQAAAQKNVDALTPSPSTTGAAFQIVHGVAEGVSLAAAGATAGGLPGAALLTGSTEGAGRYHELSEEGVSPGIAAASAGVTALASGAGVLIPGGFGSTLATRLLTGAASNVGLGMAARYADHKILEAGGYPEMAEQQKVWDSTQILTDALLGSVFGGLAHLHAGKEADAIKAAANEPGVQDAALATNLAAHDRAAAPGVPVDPEAAATHQAAMEKATNDLLQGKPVDVSETGVEQAKFLSRPEAAPSEALTAAQKNNTFKYEDKLSAYGRSTGFPQKEGTPVEKLFSNFADSKDTTPEQQDEFRRSMLARATGSERDFPPYSKAVTSVEPFDGDVSAHITASTENDHNTRVVLKTNEGETVAAATMHAGMIDSIATDKKFAGNGYGKKLLAWLDEKKIANVSEVPDRSPGFVGIQKQVLSEKVGAPIAEARGAKAGPVQEAAPIQKPTPPVAEQVPTAPSKEGAGPATAEPVSVDPVAQALHDRPNLEINDESGKPVKAADALKQVVESAAKELSDFKSAVMAATTCFGRRGG